MVEKPPNELADFATFADWLAAVTRPYGAKAALAKSLGVNSQHINKWLRGSIPEPPTLRRIAATTGVDYNALRDLAEQRFHGLAVRELPARENRRVPVVGTAQLGADGFWAELGHPVGAGDGYLDVPSDDANAYAVRVVGDSMYPRIRSGEFVLCEPNHVYGPGDEVLVVTTDGRSMVKEFLYQRDGQVVLHSVNDGHGRLTLRAEDVEKIHYVAAIVKSTRWRER